MPACSKNRAGLDFCASNREYVMVNDKTWATPHKKCQERKDVI